MDTKYSISFSKEELLKFLSDNKTNKKCSPKARAYFTTMHLYEDYSIERMIKESAYNSTDDKVLACMFCSIEEVPIYLTGRDTSVIANWRLLIGK